MEPKKLKVFIRTDFSLANTGFGKNAKNLLTYLYKTGKYDLVHYCCATTVSDPNLSRTPWRSIGCLPDDQNQINQWLSQFPENQREQNLRAMSYGVSLYDEAILQERPNVQILVQDLWGINDAVEKPYFNDIDSVIWTTLDSLPLLPMAVDLAPKIKNYWVWSSFATKAFKELGFDHVKTMHGMVDTQHFYRLNDEKRKQLRRDNNIPEDAFVMGYVFRNQLRKSVPNILKGYSIWKETHKNVKSYLILHTCLNEGWEIKGFIKDFGIDPKEILITYVCRGCRNYQVKPIAEFEEDCHICKTQKAQVTTSVGFGVNESQLNEIYNLFDLYLACQTSGGQEIPVEEAKLSECITCVTKYSFGEEACEEGSGSLPLAWEPYYEPGTRFIKATTLPSSIAENIEKVYEMTKEERQALGKQGRSWVIEKYSIEAVGKQIEEFLDSCNFKEIRQPQAELKNPEAQIAPVLDDSSWLKELYKNILKMEVKDDDSGLIGWLQGLKEGKKRSEIETYFRSVASQENEKLTQKPQTIEDLLDNNGNKRLLLVIKESIGDIFCVTSLLRSIKDNYPSTDIYIATQPEYFCLFEFNPHVHKVIGYMPQMESETAMTGIGGHRGFFDHYIFPAVSTQRFLNYLTSKNNLDVKY